MVGFIPQRQCVPERASRGCAVSRSLVVVAGSPGLRGERALWGRDLCKGRTGIQRPQPEKSKCRELEQ